MVTRTVLQGTERGRGRIGGGEDDARVPLHAEQLRGWRRGLGDYVNHPPETAEQSRDGDDDTHDDMHRPLDAQPDARHMSGSGEDGGRLLQDVEPIGGQSGGFEDSSTRPLPEADLVQPREDANQHLEDAALPTDSASDSESGYPGSLEPDRAGSSDLVRIALEHVQGAPVPSAGDCPQAVEGEAQRGSAVLRGDCPACGAEAPQRRETGSPGSPPTAHLGCCTLDDVHWHALDSSASYDDLDAICSESASAHAASTAGEGLSPPGKDAMLGSCSHTVILRSLQRLSSILGGPRKSGKAEAPQGQASVQVDQQTAHMFQDAGQAVAASSLTRAPSSRTDQATLNPISSLTPYDELDAICAEDAPAEIVQGERCLETVHSQLPSCTGFQEVPLTPLRSNRLAGSAHTPLGHPALQPEPSPCVAGPAVPTGAAEGRACQRALNEALEQHSCWMGAASCPEAEQSQAGWLVLSEDSHWEVLSVLSRQSSGPGTSFWAGAGGDAGCWPVQPLQIGDDVLEGGAVATPPPEEEEERHIEEAVCSRKHSEGERPRVS